MHSHLLDDVSLSQALLTIDEETFDTAVGVRYVDFVAHAVRLAVGLISLRSEAAAVDPGTGHTRQARAASYPSKHASTTDILIECANCGRPVREADAETLGRRFYSDGVGELLPFCGLCAHRAFRHDARRRLMPDPAPGGSPAPTRSRCPNTPSVGSSRL